jgi:hypothetical protein
MEQLSKKQAQAVLESRVWEKWTDIQLLRFQLFQKNLCMPFGKYHTTIERYLGRPVYTSTIDHQKDKLIREIFGSTEQPTINEIYNLIPAEVLNANTAEV